VSRSRLLAIAVAIAALVIAAPSRAHDVGLSRGVYSAAGSVVSAELTFSRREIIGAVPELDPDRDGVMTQEEVDRARAVIERSIVGRVDVKGDGAACAGSLREAMLVEEDGFTVRADYRCAAALAKARIELSMLDDLPHGHRHIARAGAQGGEHVLFRSSRSFELTGGSGAGSGDGAVGEEGSSNPGFLGFFLMGIEHILLGFDHLVFLLGLVLVGGRLRSMLLVVTAFTVAHSITLGVAVLGIFRPSPSVIEPLIALSIAYVGVENFFVKDAEKRWRITLPFGLIHGFGFAGALGEIRLPAPEVPAALVSFNLGVEVGQVAVLAIVLPLILAARKKKWFEDRGVKAVSAVIVLMGIFWFVTRVFGLGG
jgi:hydrogenase/urease accessory protein HupE